MGAFLRTTSLDELPQLWNVFKGEMSLVGPRPAIPYEVEAYQTWHRRRVLEAKPGITGLWQVSGRSRVKFDDMVRLDVRYAMVRSVWLDVKILILTPWSVFLVKERTSPGPFPPHFSDVFSRVFLVLPVAAPQSDVSLPGPGKPCWTQLVKYIESELEAKRDR